MRVKAEKNVSEYFRKHVTRALENQQLELEELSEFYLVNLLTEYADARRAFHLPSLEEKPLALVYGQALFQEASDRIKTYKALGDFCLFVSGFFPDSLNRKVVSRTYYISLGKGAYGNLSVIYRCSGLAREFSHLFGEFSEKFVSLTDVLGEISDHTLGAFSSGILRIYERWIRTKSERDARLLRRHGIVACESSCSQSVQ